MLLLISTTRRYLIFLNIVTVNMILTTDGEANAVDNITDIVTRLT